jgi:hypothetical protein
MNRLFGLLLVLGLLAGCRGLDHTQYGSNLSKLKTYHVQANEGDRLGIAKIIADDLTRLGYKATSGAEAPAEVDGLVTYQDVWFDNSAKYLTELHIQVREPESGKILGRTRADERPSMLGKPDPSGMVEKALYRLFAATPAPESKTGRPRGSLMERETLFGDSLFGPG